MRWKTLNHFLKCSIHLSEKISPGKIVDKYMENLTQSLEKFKHGNGPKNCK